MKHRVWGLAATALLVVASGIGSSAIESTGESSGLSDANAPIDRRVAMTCSLA